METRNITVDTNDYAIKLPDKLGLLAPIRCQAQPRLQYGRIGE